jgi:hypothetical protein
MAGRAPERQIFKVPYGLTIDMLEKEYILGSLQRNGGNKARTAEILGVSEKTLYNKLNRYAAEARGEHPHASNAVREDHKGAPTPEAPPVDPGDAARPPLG